MIPQGDRPAEDPVAVKQMRRVSLPRKGTGPSERTLVVSDPILSAQPLAPAPPLLPLYSHLLRVRFGGGGEIRRFKGGMAGAAANSAVPPLPSAEVHSVRPSAIAEFPRVGEAELCQNLKICGGNFSGYYFTTLCPAAAVFL